MDKFIEREELEREMFKKWVEQLYGHNYIVDYTFTPPGSFENYDVEMSVIDKKTRKRLDFIVEIKVREKHYMDLMLEEGKYNNLMRLSQEKEIDDVIYLNITPVGYYDFYLNDMKLYWQIVQSPKTTAGNNEKVDKKVAMLHIKDAKNPMFLWF